MIFASVQTISGTGANHLGALFLSRFYPWLGEKAVGLSNPTWGKMIPLGVSTLRRSSNISLVQSSNTSNIANHHAIFRNVGITPIDYPYYDPATIGLAFQPLLAHIKAAPEKSVFLLHPCAHNPTGVDPTLEQWGAIADVMLERGHYAFFDCAYQGFASGDLERDAIAVCILYCWCLHCIRYLLDFRADYDCHDLSWTCGAGLWQIRYFIQRKVPMLVCQVSHITPRPSSKA